MRRDAEQEGNEPAFHARPPLAEQYEMFVVLAVPIAVVGLLVVVFWIAMSLVGSGDTP